ncbi:hypothetical protein EJB05_49596, partial [Eragrostis curvula]
MEASPPHGEPSPEAPPPSLDCLPSDILNTVVSRLPVRDAVRTSALSRAWRRRWETAPGIRFILSDSDAEPPKAQAAIDAFLARYACPVRHFVYDYIEAFPHADQVLALLASRGVESLYFSFAKSFDVGHVEIHTLHPAVFSCNALTHLFLEHCTLPRAPSSFSGFPNLTSLQLSKVRLTEHGDRDLEAMIQMSPQLTNLVLRYVWIEDDEVGEWVIRAPNLQILSIQSDHDYLWQTEELPSLQQASIKITYFSTARDFVRLFTHLKQVTKLKFHMMPNTKVNALDGLSCCFWKLKEATLCTNFFSISSILYTFSILKSAPNLENLKIEIMDNYAEEDEVDMNFFNALWINGLFANLVCVTMIDVPLCSNEMHFTEFVLSKARQLRSFYIYYENCWRPNLMPHEEVVIKLKEIRRVSPKAKVVVKKAEVSTP